MLYRIKNLLKWMAMPVLAISGYLFTPIACCIPNPLFRKVMYDSCENEEPITYCESTMVSSMGGMIGTCCCMISCFGCFGKYSPETIM